MGNIIFTKQYSSTDNGSKVSGANLGQLETDIAAILNGGITNVNINSAAAIVESKLSFDTTSGHNHDGSNSRSLSAGGQRGFIQGAYLNYVAADQIKADSGVIEINGSFYTRNSYSTTIDTDTAGHWVEGASQRAVSIWAYVYAYNDSGTTWDIKFWLQAPQYANTGTDDSSVKIYRQNASVWYRCLGAVKLNATGSGNILNFYQSGNWVGYDNVYNDTDLQITGLNQAAFTAQSLSIGVPVISTNVSVAVYITVGQASFNFRPTGSSAAAGIGCSSPGANDVTNIENVITNSSQSVDYKVGANSMTLWIKGYRMNIR